MILLRQLANAQLLVSMDTHGHRREELLVEEAVIRHVN